MRIIAFVGSPVEDNEKDVRYYYVSAPPQKMCPFILILHNVELTPVSYLLAFSLSTSAACEAGKTLEKRKG